jgi:hypothetical protein
MDRWAGACLPGVGYDYVVEGGIALSEACEADFDDHSWGLVMGGVESGLGRLC